MELAYTDRSWTLRHQGKTLIEHTEAQPCCYVGIGNASVHMYRGNFDIEDYVEERVALRHAHIEPDGDALRVLLARGEHAEPDLVLTLCADAQGATIAFTYASPAINRLWCRIAAQPDEHVWGCGEQMSYFDLRGRHFPLWTSEPGVGRDKSTHLTWQADVTGKAGGDYYTTNYPQPTFVSSQRYCLHAETTAYADFDFRHEHFHELQFWAVPERIELLAADSFVALVERISARFGRQPALPDWVLEGAILGLKNGRDHATQVLELSRERGVKVSALWCEDWVGLRQTSFGKRLFWDWRWNDTRYPDAKSWVSALNASGVRFLGYVNPYLCNDGTLYEEARAAGYLATNAQGGDYLVDFGEFWCGVVDFTNPAAAQWFADRVIRREMLDAGLDGWMADFGEYLPTDVKLANGVDAMLMHNAWPTLWAKVNADAIAAAGRTGDVLFFMRAGYTGVQAHCPLLWAGDQSVDFSRHDGLQTVICGALSSGLLGNAYHHSDIGGYTSLFGNCRTAELFQRWAEMAAFTPVMRTHEGNRPDENFQFWQDDAVLEHFARMTRIYVALAPYVRKLAAQAAQQGLPLQRPLFLHFEHDRAAYAIQDQYLYGEDLLVAPVHEAGRTDWQPYLPAGVQWVHLWSGKTYEGGERVTVAAPLGEPPVFVRADSPLCESLLALASC
ncbi:alpha-glucosidase [Burkholderia multivorans]|uniref:alpha-glucosidase n=1 Tax=Burkholderia multivorans TaxID=87883 RepID=UPI0019D1476C|nr:alpha-glucosidase [Burkholderia multivorans]MBN6738836.1 alpha-glucosidase [Burkholderia multivorans]MBN7130109.1 alpha-glucosidase [Burkholderia multivorans]MBN8173466.1 alpha-glucosidase [Burkholderia multivorans]QSL29411.1 alpha-glucosidase [Burkholderia multivorans]